MAKTYQQGTAFRVCHNCGKARDSHEWSEANGALMCAEEPQKKRTATIERYHCFGTPRHHLRVTYKGRLLRWRSGTASAVADAVDYGAETLEAMKQHARNQGFTHVRIAGDWGGRTKPQGGKLF